jgi:sec-independent protein translocase protein TatA
MISFWHLVIVLVVVLLLFGPSRLEKLGPSLGKAIRGFKEGLNGDGEEADKKSLAKKTGASDSEEKS